MLPKQHALYAAPKYSEQFPVIIPLNTNVWLKGSVAHYTTFAIGASDIERMVI